MAEEVFPCSHRTIVVISQSCLQRIVERITRLFIPEQRVVLQHSRVRNRRLQIEPSIRIHGKLRVLFDFSKHCLNARAILRNIRPANLHLYDRVSPVEIRPHLRAQSIEILAGIVVSSGCIHKHARVCLQSPALRKEAKQRFARDLCHCIPYRHVNCSDGYGAFAMSTGLLIAHQRSPNAIWIDIVLRIIQHRLGIGLMHAWSETLPDQAALTVAPIRVEPIANYGSAVTHNIRNHSNQ